MSLSNHGEWASAPFFDKLRMTPGKKQKSPALQGSYPVRDCFREL
jgi:hypothetical protein